MTFITIRLADTQIGLVSKIKKTLSLGFVLLNSTNFISRRLADTHMGLFLKLKEIQSPGNPLVNTQIGGLHLQRFPDTWSIHPTVPRVSPLHV
ncbi:hypothetical protein DEO72_LG2g2670 [Vigna unguiculata]|uniref:Uncharacterized protein n=1 Tax=Vigna unguiculata TaxID=3917 RepID=A0A4D6L1I1_VIGUN|nr:hypothetical protein DEO72_LG2g2670 [Vigna unguiculata]